MKFTRLLLAALVVLATVSEAQKTFDRSDGGSPISPHQKIRDRVFAAVRGGTSHLIGTPRRPLLLAFLQMLPDSDATPSRSEALYLDSMAQQYAGGGLRVAAIASAQSGIAYSSWHQDLLNASYDWHLTFPLLQDTNGRALREFHVRTLPTVVLIDETGVIVQS